MVKADLPARPQPFLHQASGGVVAQKNEDSPPMSPDPPVFDAAYINALRAGDPATEKHFVDHFSPILLRKLRGNVRTIDQARDLRQETFLRVLSAIRSSREIRKPERFEVFVICVCNNVLREWWREQRRTALLQPVEIDLPGDAPSAYALVHAEETARNVQRVLANLKTEERRVLHALLMDEQDKDEICRRFGVSRNYLRV